MSRFNPRACIYCPSSDVNLLMSSLTNTVMAFHFRIWCAERGCLLELRPAPLKENGSYPQRCRSGDGTANALLCESSEDVFVGIPYQDFKRDISWKTVFSLLVWNGVWCIISTYCTPSRLLIWRIFHITQHTLTSTLYFFKVRLKKVAHKTDSQNILKGIVHPKMKMYSPSGHPRCCASEQIWRNLALHHLLTTGSFAVNGCR